MPNGHHHEDPELFDIDPGLLEFLNLAETILAREDIDEIGEVLFKGQMANARALHLLNRKVDSLMADITQLNEAVDALVAADGAAVTEIQELASEVATLTAGEISQEQIDSLTAKTTAATEALVSATQAAQGGGETPPSGEGETPPPAEEPSGA